MEMVPENAIHANESPIWERYLSRSMFGFASPDLEAGYQKYLANRIRVYWLLFSPMFCMGWMAVFYRTSASLAGGESSLPAGLMASVVLFFLPTLWVYALICLWPSYYKSHWRGIGCLWMTIHIFAIVPFQKVCIWQLVCSAKGLCGEMARESVYKEFAVENFYLTTVFFRIVIFSAGPVPDLLFITLSLFISLSGNGSLCTFIDREWVSLSAPMLSVVQKGSSWLLGMLPPHGFWASQISPAELSCPAVLGFWQVAGWWFGCVLMVLHELRSRKLYLKSAGSHLGPEMALMAAWWPVGNAKLVHNLICIAFALCSAPLMLWVIALSSLQ
eukprot:jgi/Botrbrau1/2586/Bobra.145_1s0014.1